MNENERLPIEYLEFIEECKSKEYDENIITHKHHILPRFIGGKDDDDNLVVLSVDDHFEAHCLLFEYVRDEYKMGALRSLNILRGWYSGDITPEIIGGWISGVDHTGENNPMYGKRHSDDTKHKMRESKVGMYVGKKNPMYGRHHTEESNEKNRQAKIGTTLSEEHKRKIGDTQRGIPQPKLQCPHCGKVGGVSGMKRFHFDNCTQHSDGVIANLNKERFELPVKKCPHCGKQGRGAAMIRYHFDNCPEHPNPINVLCGMEKRIGKPHTEKRKENIRLGHLRRNII